MNSFYFTTDEQRQYALACLAFAKKIGLIDDCSLEAVVQRCNTENEKRRQALENGEIVYGLKQFTLPVYLDYELTRFRLDFIAEKDIIKHNYIYKPIEKKQLKQYFRNNRDLFTRYHGERFRFKESCMVVYKKIREEQYDEEINAILCQLS
ncbi:MAG: hypothetical protein IJ491_07060 [Clostridia bacterium]|nr:hypothetical protein [Clostridia bacterium]